MPISQAPSGINSLPPGSKVVYVPTPSHANGTSKQSAGNFFKMPVVVVRKQMTTTTLPPATTQSFVPTEPQWFVDLIGNFVKNTKKKNSSSNLRGNVTILTEKEKKTPVPITRSPPASKTGQFLSNWWSSWLMEPLPQKVVHDLSKEMNLNQTRVNDTVNSFVNSMLKPMNDIMQQNMPTSRATTTAKPTTTVKTTTKKASTPAPLNGAFNSLFNQWASGFVKMAKNSTGMANIQKMVENTNGKPSNDSKAPFEAFFKGASNAMGNVVVRAKEFSGEKKSNQNSTENNPIQSLIDGAKLVAKEVAVIVAPNNTKTNETVDQLFGNASNPLAAKDELAGFFQTISGVAVNATKSVKLKVPYKQSFNETERVVDEIPLQELVSKMQLVDQVQEVMDAPPEERGEKTKIKFKELGDSLADVLDRFAVQLANNNATFGDFTPNYTIPDAFSSYFPIKNFTNVTMPTNYEGIKKAAENVNFEGSLQNLKTTIQNPDNIEKINKLTTNMTLVPNVNPLASNDTSLIMNMFVGGMVKRINASYVGQIFQRWQGLNKTNNFNLTDTIEAITVKNEIMKQVAPQTKQAADGTFVMGVQRKGTKTSVRSTPKPRTTTTTTRRPVPPIIQYEPEPETTTSRPTTKQPSTLPPSTRAPATFPPQRTTTERRHRPYNPFVPKPVRSSVFGDVVIYQMGSSKRKSGSSYNRKRPQTLNVPRTTRRTTTSTTTTSTTTTSTTTTTPEPYTQPPTPPPTTKPPTTTTEPTLQPINLPQTIDELPPNFPPKVRLPVPDSLSEVVNRWSIGSIDDQKYLKPWPVETLTNPPPTTTTSSPTTAVTESTTPETTTYRDPYFCESTDDCEGTDPLMVCHTGLNRCVCKPGFRPSQLGGHVFCVRTLHSPCSSNRECRSGGDPKMQCYAPRDDSRFCYCKNGYLPNRDAWCQPMFDDDCRVSKNCPVDTMTCGDDGACVCNKGFAWIFNPLTRSAECSVAVDGSVTCSEQNDMCPFYTWGAVCTRSSDPNRLPACQCGTGLVPRYSDASMTKLECFAILGSRCTHSIQCSSIEPHSFCNVDQGQCSCEAGYKQIKHRCVPV